MTKGLLFDYGGTIDSQGNHWGVVLWECYQSQAINLSNQDFREAYIYAERQLASHPIIKPNDNFYLLLQKKIALQLDFLQKEKLLHTPISTDTLTDSISMQAYQYAQESINHARPTLEKLAAHYPMVLVSNFYGNITAVLEDFKISKYFSHIIESAIVGIRKPDPAIFALAASKLNLPPTSCTVIGDSYTKDILPATTIGCKTIWLKGKQWDETENNIFHEQIIVDFVNLEVLLL